MERYWLELKSICCLFQSSAGDTSHLCGYLTLSTCYATDLLNKYRSSDSESTTDTEEGIHIEGEVIDNTASISDLRGRAVRQVYLITYSQADLETFPTESHLQKLL